MFRNQLYNLIVFAVIAVSVLSAVVGCQRDTTIVNALPSNVINFEIGRNDPTKSGVASEQVSDCSADKIYELVCAEGKDTVYLRRHVSEMSSVPIFVPDPSTKGAAVTRDNVEQFYADKLYIAAFSNDGSQYMASQAISFVSRDSGTKISTWKTSDPYPWPSYELSFWGWAPNGGNAGEVNPTALSISALSFEYTSPKGSGDYANRDAEMQKDIILANTVADAPSCGGKAHLVFKHALSAVRFEAGRTNECTINSVSLTVKSKGTCTYDPTSMNVIEWTDLQESKTFTQTFDAEMAEHLTDDGTAQQIDLSSDKSRTFMLIPQTASNVNKITLEVNLTLKNSGEQVTLTKELDGSLTDWESGKVYTYELSVVNGLEISVTDVVTDKTKSDVKISNTYSSTVKCFIRAAIIGNWFDDNGKIVEAWKVEDESFINLPAIVGVTSASNWTRGADGFYYYKYPVYPGKLTGQTSVDADGDPLFTSYTAPAVATVGSELNIQIVAQGVQWDASLNLVKEAWGETAAGYLSANDKSVN